MFSKGFLIPKKNIKSESKQMIKTKLTPALIHL